MLDTGTGRPAAIGSNPFGLYVDQYFDVRSSAVLLNTGFTEQAVRAVVFTGLGALLLTRDPQNKAGLICLTAVLIPLGDIMWVRAENFFGGSWWGEWGEWLAILVGTPWFYALSSILILLFTRRCRATFGVETDRLDIDRNRHRGHHVVSADTTHEHASSDPCTRRHSLAARRSRHDTDNDLCALLRSK